MKSTEARIAREATMLSRETIINKAAEGRMTWEQAAQVLELTSRQLRRVRKRYAAEGRLGLIDRRGGRPRRRRIAAETATRMCELKRGKYADFSMQHFYDVAVTTYGLKASYDWLRGTLLQAGVVEKTPRRGTYRRRRPRQPMRGMRLHTDGSTHAWLGPKRPVWDLVILLDDATSDLFAARFVPQECVLSTLGLLEEVLLTHGRFGELYHDRGSMYCRTTKAQAGPDAAQTGQLSRALKTLSIRQIWAYSPQARGRCERAFRTIQGRLCAELKAAAITDYDAANAYLTDVFIPDFNARFTVPPSEPESTFVPLSMTRAELKLVLTVQHERIVNNDYTVHYERRILQLPKPTDSRVLCRQKVTVHTFPNGTLAVTHHGCLLAYFESEDPARRRPGERHYAPHGSPPPPTQRGGPDFSDPHFWAALTPPLPDPIVRRHDLFVPTW